MSVLSVLSVQKNELVQDSRSRYCNYCNFFFLAY